MRAIVNRVIRGPTMCYNIGDEVVGADADKLVAAGVATKIAEQSLCSQTVEEKITEDVQLSNSVSESAKETSEKHKNILSLKNRKT